MLFNEIMALIMPSIISVFFYTKVKQKRTTWYETFSLFVLFSLITNAALYALLVYIIDTKTLLFSIAFTMKYSVLATITSIIVATLYRFIELNVTFNMKVESMNEKNN